MLFFVMFQSYLENYTFLPFSGFLAIFWIFTYKKVPETKNKTFEEILSLFRHGNGRYDDEFIDSRASISEQTHNYSDLNNIKA